MLQPTPFPTLKWMRYIPHPPSLTSKPWWRLSWMTFPRKEQLHPSIFLRSQYPPVMPLSYVTHQLGPPAHWFPLSPAARCSMPSTPSRTLVSTLHNGCSIWNFKAVEGFPTPWCPVHKAQGWNCPENSWVSHSMPNTLDSCNIPSKILDNYSVFQALWEDVKEVTTDRNKGSYHWCGCYHESVWFPVWACLGEMVAEAHWQSKLDTAGAILDRIWSISVKCTALEEGSRLDIEGGKLLLDDLLCE